MNSNNSGTNCRRPNQRPEKIPELPRESVPAEPAMRRWPHPIPRSAPSESLGPELHALTCLMTAQNQLLAEIRDLLDRMTDLRSQ